MAAQTPSLIGKIALHYNLITPEQHQEAVREQGPLPSEKLGEVLLRMGFITQEQLDWLLKAQEQVLAKQAQAGRPGAQGAPARPAQAAQAGQGQQAANRTTAVAQPAAQAAPAAEAPRREVAAQPLKPISGNPLASSRSVERLLTHAAQMRASDIHIHAHSGLQFRLHGKLETLTDTPLNPADTERALLEILTDEQRQQFNERQDIDFAYTVAGVGRFRCNYYRQRRGIDGVFRAIPPSPPTLDELGLPRTLARLVNYHQGLVLLTGPAGCGKSSTLAALVRLINEERKDHIITVEDPIEYQHASARCSVNQRQVQKHTESFASALRAALREDPDVIVIGEMRDLETTSLAITAAETGHLVLATLHTNSAVRTIHRILDVFPPKQQAQIRAMVSESLRAVVSQRLVPVASGAGRVPAIELMITNTAISNLIREGKTFQIRSALQTGKALGMCLLDDSLLELVKAGTITKEQARRFAEDPKPFA